MLYIISKSLLKMSYLTFWENTRQGEAARDPAHKFSSVDPTFQTGQCGNGWAVENVAGNPGMIPKGNYGNSPEGGCAANTSNDLWFGAPGTARLKGPKQVFPRPWATTPFLGLGTLEGIEDQNKVVFGHSTANRKSIQTVSDKQFPVFQPLLPELQDDYSEYSQNVATSGRGYPSNLDKKVRVDLSS
jgi:hypothetical protein